MFLSFTWALLHRAHVEIARDFWRHKVEGTKVRDGRDMNALTRRGWKGLTTWECQLADTVRRGLEE